jgi:hypothetical protein
VIIVIERVPESDRPTVPRLVLPELYPALFDPDATERRRTPDCDIAVMMLAAQEDR